MFSRAWHTLHVFPRLAPVTYGFVSTSDWLIVFDSEKTFVSLFRDHNETKADKKAGFLFRFKEPTQAGCWINNRR